jgi:hypothetical protein
MTAGDDLDRRRSMETPARSNTNDEFDQTPAAHPTAVRFPWLSAFAEDQEILHALIIKERLISPTSITTRGQR